MTLRHEVPLDGAPPTELELVGAMALADVAEVALGLSAQIKWPGDVMVNRRRVAQASAEGEALVLELRVDEERADLPPGEASLLTIDGKRREVEPLRDAVLERLESHHARWREGGIDALYATLGARDFLRGRRVAFDGVEGRAIQIDRAGRLEVDVDGAVQVLERGSVTHER